MEIDDRLMIATPEGVELELTLAGVGSRFASALIDIVIQVALIIAIVFAAGIFDRAGAGWGSALTSVLAFVVILGYDIFFEVLQAGRTPGKRVNGLRVVQASGQPITFVPSAIRNVLRIVDILPFAYLVGIAAILATRRNQRVGDIVAATVVVRERFAGDRAATELRPATFAGPEGMVLDVTGLTTEEALAVRRFLERRFEIEPAVRARIAQKLVLRLRPKLGAVPPGLEGERLLEAIAAARDGHAGFADRLGM